MAISLLTSIITVFSLLETDEYDPDEDVCVLWDRGSSSYTYDDECLSYAGEDPKVAIGVLVVGSTSFSGSLLLFLYSISKKQKDESESQKDESESITKADRAIILGLEELIELLKNNNPNKEEKSNTILQQMIELDEESENIVEETIECGSCGAPVQDTDPSCTSCGAEFEVEDDSNPVSKCEGCYTTIEHEDTKFCDACSVSLKERSISSKMRKASYTANAPAHAYPSPEDESE